MQALTKNFKVSPSIEDETKAEKASIEQKTSSKREKLAKIKSAKKKVIKEKHSGTSPKAH